MPLPTVILPGYLAAASDYRELEKSLVDRGFPNCNSTTGQERLVVDLRRAVDGANFALARSHIKQILQQYSVSQTNLVGHSAGG